MVRHRSTIILAVSAAWLGALVGVASANPITGCNNPADSALNQYCETIPTPTGGHRPVVGTPAVATTLPPAVVRQLQTVTTVTPRGRRVRSHRKLLTLPAAQHRTPIQLSTAATSSLSLWIILILVAVVLAIGAGAFAERRRRQQA